MGYGIVRVKTVPVKTVLEKRVHLEISLQINSCVAY